MNAVDKFNQRAEKKNSLLCVGLDSDTSKMPARFQTMPHPQFEFNKSIIAETAEFVAAFKSNIAFYEAQGEQGIHELKLTMDYLNEKYPDIFTICDAKRGDIGSTNEGYVTAIFDWLGFDAVTISPYLGREAVEPFLKRKDKVSIVLCRTSNPGAGEFQDLDLSRPSATLPRPGEGLGERSKPLWQIVAEKVSADWNANHNCMLVVGATYPEEMKTIRSITGDMTFLVPGIGAQGGDIKASVEAGLNSEKKGMIINSSRGIIFADDPAAEARKLRDEINKYR